MIERALFREEHDIFRAAIALAKRSFNAGSDSIRGVSNFALHALKMFYDTPESKEGVAAFNEKRTPDFNKFSS
jgi:2-ketocyclohexanecarboxyl-CoA hydrolase